ncbi:Opacity-related protein POPM1 [Frankliniella fusca]|uniref:Opacity-related protein POPM1 n=1 Tax=Frankliniella fusca TaxID=407009 RepID=A0AAE1LY10_9NEOP|nr:Opacity-related protein POPM1 [Frankliniella fusca]
MVDFANRALIARAFDPDANVYGVKGPTLLSAFLPDLVRCMGIDADLHGLFSGQMKALLDFWFNSPGPYSISALVDLRVPRSIKQELVPLLYGILPDEFWEHHCKLVSAVSLLSQDSVSPQHIQTADELLHIYVRDFQHLYGIRYLGLNVHQLLHLSMVVKNLGPLFVYSCFTYESLNGKLSNLVHGTRHAALQICSSSYVRLNLSVMISKLEDCEAKRLCLKFMESGKKKVQVSEVVDHETYIVDKCKLRNRVPQFIRRLLRDDLNIVGGRVKFFLRLKKKGNVYCSEDYIRSQQILHNDIPHLCKIKFLIRWSSCDQNCPSDCVQCPKRVVSIVETYDRIPWRLQELGQNITIPHLNKLVSSSNFSEEKGDQSEDSCVSGTNQFQLEGLLHHQDDSTQPSLNQSANHIRVPHSLAFDEEESQEHACSSSTPLKVAALNRAFEVVSPINQERDLSRAQSTSGSDSEWSEDSSILGSADTNENLSLETDQESDSNSTYSTNCDNGELCGNRTFDLHASRLQTSQVDVFLQADLWNQKKFHHGSDMTLNEAILQMMKLYLKNHESKSGFRRIVSTFSSMFPGEHCLPSAGSILNYIERLAPPVSESLHSYCKDCLGGWESDENGACKICKTRTPVAVTVKYLFEHRNLSEIINGAKRNEDHFLRDIQDSSVYKELNANRNEYDLTLILNSDGVRIRKGSHNELWLLLCTIVEVPIQLRSFFMIVLGVWYDSVAPNMNTFMKPFSQEMKILFECGVQWRHPKTGLVHNSKIRVQLVVADAPARAKLQNILNFNGRYGCNTCEVKTVRSTPIPDKKTLRVYPYVHVPKLRNQEKMLAQARYVLETGVKHKKGVKGASALSLIPGVDISRCIIPEYMHCVLLGVTKCMLCLFTETAKQGPWSIRRSLPQIDSILKSIKHPDFIHRTQRQLKSLCYWKASDFMYFLLYESLPVLKQFLSDNYFQHFMLLVMDIYLLMQKEITEADIVEADLYLRFFVNQFPQLYSDREQTSNLHNLCHLSLCVQRHGPLHLTSAFPFESMNGIIAKATHGTNQVAKEIAKNIKITQGIHILQKIVNGNGSMRAQSSDGSVLGKALNFHLPPEETSLLGFSDKFKVYSRAKIGYDTFTSELHKPLQTANHYILWKSDSETKYGSIKYFIYRNGTLYVCVKPFAVDQLNVLHNSEILKVINHIVPVKLTNCIDILSPDVFPSIVKVGKIDNFIFVRPHPYHEVL